MRKITTCVLLYGDHPDLARRCLSSIFANLPKGSAYISDFRLGLNEVGEASRDRALSWAKRVLAEFGIPTTFYTPERNVFKYPLMRRMFYSHTRPSEYIMWFDDDSFFAELTGDWWSKLMSEMENHAITGQHWLMPLMGNQWKWIQAQSWYNPQVGEPKLYRGRRHLTFCQGAWWVAWRDLLEKYDWPIPELRHNGGDSMLGELLRHQGIKMGRFVGRSTKNGIRINADNAGSFSKAKRRGYTESRIGWDYTGRPLPTGHQIFECNIQGVE